jgi:hypothetical protein
LELEAGRLVRRPVSGAAALADLRAGRLKIGFVAGGKPIPVVYRPRPHGREDQRAAMRWPNSSI